MQERASAYCMICGELKSCRHVNLYVIGSEGLVVCHTCEMEVVSFVQIVKRIGAIGKRTGYKAGKEERNLATKVAKEQGFLAAVEIIRDKEDRYGIGHMGSQWTANDVADDVRKQGEDAGIVTPSVKETPT